MSTIYSTMKRRSLQKLWSKLDEFLLPLAKKGVVVAVSGGPDSRCLLESLACWPGRFSGKFIVVSIDHKQRKSSAAEADYISMRARRLGFLSITESLPPLRGSNEHELRNKRYRLLAHVALNNDCKVICTAHHRDDDSEGFLMALFGVGGGELGAGMNEVQILMTNIFLVRPFLSLTKADLLLTLTLCKQTDFVRDSLDDSRRGERSYVRHEVLPSLARHSPGVMKRLATFGRIERNRAGIIDNLVKSLVIWRNGQAEIALKPGLDTELLTNALWTVVKKLSNDRDLRASQPTIEKLIREVVRRAPDERPLAGPGLDHKPNAFNLKYLSRKEYQFPGVLVVVETESIIARRV